MSGGNDELFINLEDLIIFKRREHKCQWHVGSGLQMSWDVIPSVTRVVDKLWESNFMFTPDCHENKYFLCGLLCKNMIESTLLLYTQINLKWI